MTTITCPKCGKSLTVNPDDGDMIFCEYCGAKVNINVNYNFNYNYSKSEHTEHIIDDAKIKAAENANRVIGIFATPFEEYRAQKDHQRHMEEEAQRAAEERTQAYYRQMHEDAERRAERARVREAERVKQWRACEKKILKVCRKHPKETLLSLTICTVLFFSGIAAWSNYATKQQQLADHRAELAQLKQEEIAASHLAMGEAKMPDIETNADYRIVKQDLENAGFTNITTEPIEDLYSTSSGWYNRTKEVTVDGVPRLEVGSWYPVDVPIVIAYRTVAQQSSGASSSTGLSKQDKEAAWSTAHQVLSGAVTVLNDFNTNLERANDYLDQLAGPSDYDYAFSRIRIDCTDYYLIDIDNKLVYHIIEPDDSDDITTATVGHITSGDLSTGLVIHYNYDPSWDEMLTLDGSDMVATDNLGFTHRYKQDYLSSTESVLSRAYLQKEG